MGIFGKNGIMNVIRCDAQNYLIWKWHPKGSESGSSKRENAVRVEHPLVVKRPPVEGLPLNNPKRINAIYQGEVNHQMRPAESMLTAFANISKKDSDVSLHVFASGNAVEDIEKAIDENKQLLGMLKTNGLTRFDFCSIKTTSCFSSSRFPPSKNELNTE